MCCVIVLELVIFIGWIFVIDVINCCIGSVGKVECIFVVFVVVCFFGVLSNRKCRFGVGCYKL